tara:strand:+ start:678 stop:2258 length:1581 start_codon:yes stop_codon:yes gene_type:complete
MDESNNTIFTHAKMEYTSQLVEILTPQFFDGIKSIYDESKTVHRSNNSSNTSILVLFRIFLEKVPTWSNEVIETETNRIVTLSSCDWLNDLITAVFISHTKILTAIGSNNNSNIELVIPKTINFIHKCYINIAREIWKNPYLFDDYVVASDYQRNMRTIELLIKESIENTIRKLLPVKEILKQQLDIYDTNNEIKNKVSSNEIRKMLLDELKSLKNIQKDEVEGEDFKKEECGDRVDSEVHEYNSNITPVSEDIDEGDTVNNNDDYMGNGTTGSLNIGKPIEDSLILGDQPENEEGYTSPDEDEIKNKCNGLEITTIPDIMDTTEEKYDNNDIITDSYNEGGGEEQKSILETYLDDVKKEKDNSMIHNDGNIDKGENIMSEIIDEPLLGMEDKEGMKEKNDNSLLEGVVTGETQDIEKEEVKVEDVCVLKKDEEENNEVSDEKIIKEDKGDEGDDNSIEIKDDIGIQKELITIEKNDENDNETVDLFYEDISKLMEKKGINVDKLNRNYTLFDDAIVEEDEFQLDK